MRTLVECFGLRLESDRLLGRRVVVRLEGHPDDDAARAIGLHASALDGVAVLHSTSWRLDPDSGDLVLTYVCCPDPDMLCDGCELIVARPPEASPCDPSRPSATDLSACAVLHHGICHLAWLADNTPHVVSAAQAARPDLWAAILGADRARAGQLARPDGLQLAYQEPLTGSWS